MKIGTKSILFGAHCFFLHPFAVAEGWRRLYGFPWDPRLWIAFFIHDLGYWGHGDLDTELADMHPEFGANIMHALFGMKWYTLVMFHSRYVARRYNVNPSKLCWADKMAPACTPWWIYVPMCRLTGELRLYTKWDKDMDHGLYDQYADDSWRSDIFWYRRLQTQWEGVARANAARIEPAEENRYRVE